MSKKKYKSYNDYKERHQKQEDTYNSYMLEDNSSVSQISSSIYDEDESILDDIVVTDAALADEIDDSDEATDTLEYVYDASELSDDVVVALSDVALVDEIAVDAELVEIEDYVELLEDNSSVSQISSSIYDEDESILDDIVVTDAALADEIDDSHEATDTLEYLYDASELSDDVVVDLSDVALVDEIAVDAELVEIEDYIDDDSKEELLEDNSSVSQISSSIYDEDESILDDIVVTDAALADEIDDSDEATDTLEYVYDASELSDDVVVDLSDVALVDEIAVDAELVEREDCVDYAFEEELSDIDYTADVV